MLDGDLAGGGQIAGRWDDDSGLAHDRFEEHRRGVVGYGGRQGVDISVGHMGDFAEQRSERRRDFRVAGQSQRSHPADHPGGWLFFVVVAGGPEHGC
jgi:hypothetical protein